MNDETEVPLDPESTSAARPPEIHEAIDVQIVNPTPAADVIESIDTEIVAPELRDEPQVRSESPTISLEPLQTSIETLGETLCRRLDGLQALFDREIRAESSREKVVDRLHAELQEYKQDLVQSLLRPVFIDLIQLHDDIGKMTDAQADGPSEASSMLVSIQQGIEDILYRHGVEPFSTDTETFDPRRQRAVATVPTDDPKMTKVIAIRVRKGFASGEKIIRPELVKVFSHKS
ncbi:MAG TPA: nucleotide exchange factor GrpE [Isosphaeraceae bacterium]|nr:nucleotide exchange factor GrpE [Isosphaeraceae bacterium]